MKCFISQQAQQRAWLFVWLTLSVVVAGLRFSDGSLLLAMSRGADIHDPVFSNIASQYVWDSPLKVYLLRWLPSSLVAIALMFSVLGALPLIMLFFRDGAVMWVSSAGLFLTPAFKIDIQNLGVGDGLIVFLTIIVCLQWSPWIIGFAFFLMGVWHPQQSFFIGTSWFIGQIVYGQYDLDASRVRIAAGFVGLASASVIFFSYKSGLGFDYSDRSAYMVQRLPEILLPNLRWAPIALLPALLWFILLAPQARYSKVLGAWCLVLGGVSLLTTDVTRVFTLTSLPIVLFGASRLYSESLSNRRYEMTGLVRVALLALAVLLIPPYSWSGLDWWLWSDLFADFCKWGFFCR